MKTAEKILITSLDLFNEQGENNVNSVDISLELDISPGNLYYHFKGKEIIVAALFDMYQERLNKLLKSPNAESLNVKDFFYFLYLVLESAYLFRFLYRNPSDIAQKYPDVGKKFRRLLLEKEKSLAKLIEQFSLKGELNIAESQRPNVVELIAMVFTQAPNYYLLKNIGIEEENYIYRSLTTVLFVLTPYLNLERDEFVELYESVNSRTLTES